MPTGAPCSAGERRSSRLRPSDRLRKRFEFRRVRDEGRRVHTKSFVLLVTENATSCSRLGITVSKQVGNAVRRNRVKRLVREVFRRHRELFPEQADVVVIAKTGCPASSFMEVRAEIEAARKALRRSSERASTRPRGGNS